MAVGDIYEVVVQQNVKGEFVNNSFHVQETDACTDMLPAETLALAVQDAWIDDWAALLSEETVFAGIYARRVRPAPGPTFTVLDTSPGDVADEAIPSCSALLVSWVTNLASKSGRGRTYFAGLPESAQNGGSLAAASVAGWEAFATLLKQTFPAIGAGTGEWALCVYSRKLLSAEDILMGVVRSNLATQRKRRQRPGTS